MAEETTKAFVKCPDCDGKGLNPENYHELCDTCKGSGKALGEKPKAESAKK